MLEGVLASILNRFLASYVDGLNTNQLNVAIWSGDVKLRNLRLKRSALDKLRLPIDVKEGLPWPAHPDYSMVKPEGKACAHAYRKRVSPCCATRCFHAHR